ncbi:glycosyltransferase family 2 protein [Cellulomonas dongxiuzhuiae]|uniref:Glycosyltransferase family 2 protein n=1 Tax=Cellulomonas dongxiuzhuiae TaxID=2819979 RepID=A0ABX8GID5_9CELL|nr:glycosyltransferase family 2 protein [Cellulomonas dongxiuzhuiae]MBO3087880.1 glycosyltransferase [Cellulomonas dongxiuzhuiae]MBO3094771.1 glycosyltransferase [Cellulomonas dongxiuzhuiae]QWC15765.1 glycosyltransferase family 2 protein [Cellulomonas dongxiuzhuiae]
MFIFILQLRHMFEGQNEIYLFAVFSTIVWALWILKVVLSRRYRPVTAPYAISTSVVVPVVDEPLDLFRDVLRRIVEQQPDEVIVVINGAPNPGLEGVCDEFAPVVQRVHTPIPGKRNAVKIGTVMSHGDITVLVDSDTVWTDGALDELVKPFADPSVGGVTTRQRILEPNRSWITRWADWLENTRALYSMPAQSVLGQVGCLPGRTIAFRRHILMSVMDKFMTEKFLGVFLEVSDDRTLTNLTLKAGYRTVYQHTSLVYTDAPLEIKKLYKQQLRWSRGSQYNTLRMLPWMLGHAPVLSIFFLVDIILPFLLFGTVAGWVYRAVSGTGINLYQAILETTTGVQGLAWVVSLMIVSSVLSMAIRQIRHLQEKPSDFLRLPVFIITSTLFLMPIRIIGFFRMAHVAGWGTRAGAYVAGQQDASDGDLMAQLEDTTPHTAPVDVVDRPTVPTQAGHAVPRVSVLRPDAQAAAGGRVALRAETRLRAQAQAAPAARRRGNPLALVPYLIGILMFALMAVAYV